MQKKVGIVTVLYNSGPVLEAFMRDTLAQTHRNFELYIIDNVSTDNSVEIVEQFSDERIHLIKNTENSGVAGGNNTGIFKALKNNCDFIWLLNNDVEFETTYLEKMVAAAEAQQCSMVTTKMMYYFDKRLIWYGGSYFSKRSGNMAVHQGLREEDNGQLDENRYVDYAPTCSVLFDKKVFEDIGYMDEQYFAYYDDTDFLLRAYKTGKHKMYYIGDVEFYHKIGQSSQSKKGGIKKFKFGDFHIKLTTRNKVYYLRKQGDFWAKLNILIFAIRMRLRFFFSGKYNVNWKTWKLMSNAFREGMQLKVPKKNYLLKFNKEEDLPN